MPIGVASIGDIVALCLLTKDLITALNQTRGSSRDFQQLVKQLQSLASVLHEVDLLTKREKITPSLDAIRVTLSRIAADCQDLIEPFYGRLRGYQDRLKLGGSGRVLHDAACKWRWKFCEADEVERLRADLLAHTMTMQTLIGVWNLYVSLNW